MDSEDSRDSSSGNDSDKEDGRKSRRSSSCSSSDSDGGKSASPRSRSGSRSSSNEGGNGPHSPKSADSASLHSGPRSPSPGSRSRHSRDSFDDTHRSPPGNDRVVANNEVDGPRSPMSDGPRSPTSDGPRSPENSNGPRSPSPRNSSRSSSAESRGAYRKSSGQENGFKNSRSPSSNKSKSPSVDGLSDKSGSTISSKRGRKDANLDDGITSDSSDSSASSSRRKPTAALKNADVQPEEISDGDMDSDHDSDSDGEYKKKEEKPKVQTSINITHEDLSDVSDLDDSIGVQSDEEALEKQALELRQQIEEIRKPELEVSRISDKATEDGEEQLDFEAEDGECEEKEVPKDKEDAKESSAKESGEIEDDAKEEKEREELEEGEVTDEDDARPEETEPRPVCRFFSRGQCTWGASCRFLHPGVTDKGNYTMFEMIRPVIPGEYGREERLYGRPEPPPMESAWERGLRTAKEMLRKSIKRKEQDIDFEEKKMNLSLAQEELDKENGYYARVPTPEPRYVVRHPVPVEYPPVVRAPPEEYYGRRQVLYEPEYVPPPRERVRTFRELPSHRMPDFYNNKYEDETPQANKPKRPKREVIVQRAEERQGRGDEWSDPWMRSKSPQGRKGGRKRSYSSGSSYSTSSSSRSTSGTSRSSYKSRSRSPRRSRRSPRAHRGRQAVSPSVIVSERKAASERAALMNPPAPKKKAPSPGMMRAGAQNPPAPSKADQFGRTRSKLAVAAALARVKSRQRSRSSSGSSGSSSSDTDSSDSSSSTSRDGSPPRRTSGVSDLAMALKAKAIDALKGGNAEKRQIKLNLKNPMGPRKTDLSELSRKVDSSQGKKRPLSPSSLDPKSAANKKATSRREELLKQLKAVEDAIAKKRSKVN